MSIFTFRNNNVSERRWDFKKKSKNPTETVLFFCKYNTLNIYLRETHIKKRDKKTKKSQKKPPKSVALFLSVFGGGVGVGFAFRREESNNGDTKEEKEEEGRRRLFPTTTTTLRESALL